MPDLLNAIIESFQRYWTETIQPNLAPTVTNLVLAVIIVFAFYRLSLRLRGLATVATSRTRADASTALLIGRLVEIGVIVLGVIVALSVLGVQLAALITVIGAFSLAISFATQDVLKNFVAGLYLLIERPFRIGQEVKIKDHTGRVETVGIRTTVLKTEENIQVVIPNSVIFTEVVINRDAYGGASPKPEPARADATSTTASETAPTSAAGSPPSTDAAGAARRPAEPRPTEPGAATTGSPPT